MDVNSADVDGRRTDTRARILDVASRHFRERGYSDTSMQEIADELGVTKAALYYHFGAKREILHALVEPIFTAVEDILAGDCDCSTAEGRRDYLASLIVTFDAAGPIVASVAIDPRAAADILETVSTSTLVDRIAAHLVEGLVREGRAGREAAAIRVAGALNAIQGMIDAWVHESKGASSMNQRTRGLMVAVAVAGLEVEVPA
jgi:AcrR family transcriptional regulator